MILQICKAGMYKPQAAMAVDGQGKEDRVNHTLDCNKTIVMCVFVCLIYAFVSVSYIYVCVCV
jgi:hypothetical protein